MASHQTNTEAVIELMDWAKSGPLMQAFVIEAISRYARECAEHAPEVFDSPMLNGRAWHRCAVEAKEAMERHLKP